MDWDYKLEKDKYIITFENGKMYFIRQDDLNKEIRNSKMSEFEKIELWLEDKGYLINDELEELDKEAKGKVKVIAETQPRKKTQKERVQKENPTKELIIQTIYKALEQLEVNNLTIENKAKLITFTLNNEDFKVDLVQKRKEKVK